MGLFSKWAQQQTAQPSAGEVHVSSRSVAADDPIWQPINGISLQDYGELARDARAGGVTDEAGMIALAQERGWTPADTKAALDGWVQRMGQSMAVGQQFRKFLGY